MKKLSLILLFGALIFVAPKVNAQSTLITANTAALIPNIDTVTNTGVKSMTSGVVKSSWHTVTVSVVLNKISGTGAGTAILNGSIDGVNYSPVAASQLIGAQTASYTITNVANQSYNWVVAQSPFLYYQVTVTGSGTEVLAINGKYLAH